MMSKMFVAICISILIEALTGTSIAASQDQDEESESVALDVVRLMMHESEAMDTIKQEGGVAFSSGLKVYLQANMHRKLTETEDRKLQDLSRKIMEDLVDRQGIEEAEVQIYQKYFNNSELTELLSFYNTSLGRKILKHQPVLLAERQAMMRDLFASKKQTFYKRFLVGFVTEFPDLAIELGSKSSESRESVAPGSSRRPAYGLERCSLESKRLLGGCRDLNAH